LFSLCGADPVYLTDLRALIDKHTLAGGLECLCRNRQRILDTLHLDLVVFDRKFAREVGSEREFLETNSFVYLAPCDCRHLRIDVASIDAITSRSVFEHIPPPIIEDILKECYRLLTPGGPFHRSCRSLGAQRYNHFASQFPAIQRSSVSPDPSETMLRACGFEIVKKRRNIDPKALVALHNLPLSPRFPNSPRKILPLWILICSPESRNPVALGETSYFAGARSRCSWKPRE
jgi:SAM-dependent methyltransferase